MSTHEGLIIKAIEQARNEIWNEGAQQGMTKSEADAETLGICVAHWAEWDIIKILQVVCAALEDANFHTEAGSIQDMLNNIKKESEE